MQSPYGPGYPQQMPYGQPPPKKGLSGWVIALIVGGCLFAGSCVVCGAVGAAVGRNGGGSQASPGSPAAKPQQPTVSVSSATLFSDYQANEVAADDKYKGKSLLVVGPVADIKKDFADNIVVALGTANQFMPVDARVRASEKSDAARLTKGSMATLRCRGNGMVIGRPQLVDCTID